MADGADAQDRVDVHPRGDRRCSARPSHHRQRRAGRRARRADRRSDHPVSPRHVGGPAVDQPTPRRDRRPRCPDEPADLLRRTTACRTRAVGNDERRPERVRLRARARRMERPSTEPAVASSLVRKRRRTVRVRPPPADRARIARHAARREARGLGSRSRDRRHDPDRRCVARHRPGRPHPREHDRRRGRRRPARCRLEAPRRPPRCRNQPRLTRRHPHLGRRLRRPATDGVQRRGHQPHRRPDQPGRRFDAGAHHDRRGS